MQAIHLRQVIEKDGEVKVTGLPVKKGQAVEMTLRVETEQNKRRALTSRELARLDFVGMWKDRQDIRDSASFARMLREQSQNRQGYKP